MMSVIPAAESSRGESTTRPARRRGGLAALGLLPFFLFAIAFLFLPISFLVIGSFLDNDGAVTAQNYVDLQQQSIVIAFQNSLIVSGITALVGGIFGFLLAYAVVLGGLPRFIGAALTTFSGVASNFAGVPLALAFVFTLGQAGLVTKLLMDTFGLNLYESGFSLYTILGLSMTYLYFQFPLMLLIITPAISGLRREWREASENMGANTFQYWRFVALPILMPSLLGTMILLFGNAFGAQATAFQLTGGTIRLVPIVIGAQIRGDVLHNPGLGYAMAMGMVAIMGVSILIYVVLQRRAERWLR
jgi:putative spermidine/putrescine transport system permease protein